MECTTNALYRESSLVGAIIRACVCILAVSIMDKVEIAKAPVLPVPDYA